MNLTEKSLAVFLEYARIAGDWNGTPLVDGDKSERGNLTDLKKNGLITTFKDDGLVWLEFTAFGKAFAAEHGFEI